MHWNIPVALVIGVTCAMWGYRIADRRGRSHTVAVLVCFFFGLLGVGVYALATRKPKATPATRTELAPIP
jgi:hypothetical protein